MCEVSISAFSTHSFGEPISKAVVPSLNGSPNIKDWESCLERVVVSIAEDKKGAWSRVRERERLVSSHPSVQKEGVVNMEDEVVGIGEGEGEMDAETEGLG